MRTREANTSVDPGVLLDEFEAAIESLRIAFEKYFLGIERVAPTRQREQVQRQLRQLEALHFRTTAQRFRLGGLRSRWVTYGQYWTRVLDQMERGVWRRDVARQVARERSQHEAANSGPNVEASGPSGPSGPSKSAPGPAAVDLEEARQVFTQLVAAKQSLGEVTEGLTFAAFVRRLERETPKLQEQFGGRGVRFAVEVREGKARLRARPG